MTKYGKESADEFMNLGGRSAAINHGVKYAKSQGLELLDAAGLQDLWKNYVCRMAGKVRLFTNNNGNSQFELNIYLAVLMHLPHFYEAYQEYLLDMDDGLQIAVPKPHTPGTMEEPQDWI